MTTEHEVADRGLVIQALSLAIDFLSQGDDRGCDLLEQLLDRLLIDEAVCERFGYLTNGATVAQVWN